MTGGGLPICKPRVTRAGTNIAVLATNVHDRYRPGAMGRRSRNRAAADGAPAPAPEPKPRRAARGSSMERLNPARRVIAAYLGGAAVVGVLTLLGIATLGGTFGPIIVFLVVLALSAALIRFAAARLAGHELTDEDRLMRLLATGVLIVAVVLALVSAVVGLAA